VCDLSEVEFLGAVGLGVLAELGGRTAASGVELRLVVATRAVRRVLELTALDQAWPIHERLLEAIGAPGDADS
jgi:anti-sigma B factor antagonist